MIESGEKSFKTMREKVEARLKELGIRPDTHLGQHFLIDKPTVDALANKVSASTVIEIGAGIGQLTEELAKRASRVVAVEVDRRYKPLLDKLAKQHPNIDVLISDALQVEFGRGAQIIASLPYHISEPFLRKIAGTQIESAVLLVGKQLADAVQSRENDPAFGQNALLIDTFFDGRILRTVSKDKFEPKPRTESAIIELIPKPESEYRNDARLFILRRLFRSPRSKIKNSLKEALVEFFKYTQNEARSVIEKLYLHPDLLDRSLSQLNRAQLKELSTKLREL